MEISWHKLNGQYECERRRSLKCEITEKSSTAVKQAGIQKDLLKDVLAGRVDYKDIDSELSARMEGIPYKSGQMKKELMGDMSRRVKRASRSFLTNMHATLPGAQWIVRTKNTPMDIEVETPNETITIKDVCPDIIVQQQDWIQIYRIRTGAPRNKDGTTYTKDDASADKQLYALLKYGEKYAEDLSQGKKYIRAGYIFLRKSSDALPSKTRPNGHFDEDLFTDDRMQESGNVVTIIGTYDPASAGKKSGTDSAFEPIFCKYAEGYGTAECTKEQCEGCDYDYICRYEHAPVRLDTKKEGTELSLISLSGTQRDIELFDSGYALVNAVPGAGKTLVLTLRTVRLLNNGVLPEEIVILTFTNSGAEVFKERITKYNDEIGTGEDLSQMTATTFNGLGQMILEREYKSLGFTRKPRVIDPIERKGIIAEFLNQYSIPGLDYRNFTTEMKNCQGALAAASRAFAVIKQKGYTKYDAAKISSEVGARFCPVEAAEALADLYDIYNAKLKERGLVEYADQEMIILDMLRRNPEYFDQFGWKHILVDECQDTSANQFELLRYMTQTPSFESLMVVGDDSQAIYGFRDTSPKFFMNFEETMQLPADTVQSFYMTDNFRSTPEIINFANRLIDMNDEKIVKEILPRNDAGDPVSVNGYFDAASEYADIIGRIKKEAAEGVRYEDIAFVAGTRTELMKMASLMAENGIPSVMLNPERYLENSRVLAGLSLAKYFQDTNSIKDILISLNAALGGELLSLTEDETDAAVQMKQREAKEISAKPEPEFREKFFELLSDIDEDDEIYESFVESLDHQPTMARVFAYCNDFELYGEKAEKRREHSYPGVVLTTAHSSKGMEWPIVHLSVTKFDDREYHGRLARKEDIEEKRRLLFVAATRAREKLSVTGVWQAFGKASDPTFNQFLFDCLEANGQEVSKQNLIAQVAEHAQLRRIERERERKERIEKLRAGISTAASGEQKTA